MNLILLFEHDFISTDTARISGRRYVHLCTVLKAEQGRSVKVGLLNAGKGTGEVIELSHESALIRVNLDTSPPQPVPLSLIIALPRPKILKRVMHCAAVMGVKKIALIRTWKVDKSYWQSPVAENDRLVSEMILGLEQAGDTVLPKVEKYPLFKPFVEDHLEELITGTTPLLAHPGSGEKCPVHIRRPATVAIGPEAGFTPYEIEMITGRGFTPVNIGDRILRVDQAVPALISRLFPG